MGDVEVVEVTDFKMKQMIRFRITSAPDQVNSLSSLVATSTQFGLLFVGSNSKILVARVSDLVEIDSSHVKKSQEVSSFPHREILLPSSPVFISLSSDSLTLLVCLQKSNCPVAWLFDVRGFARQDGAWGPFQEVRLSPTDGVTVHDCSWNPTMPGLVAISLSDGSLLTVEVSGTQFTLNSIPSSTGAGVISWSPKGKQLVVARPGKLVQYKPDLKEAKTIPFTGGEIGMSQPNVVGLQWLSTVQFLATFVDEAEAGARPHLFVVNSHKTGPPTLIDYDDICFGNSSDGRTPRYNSLTIPVWNILLVASANAMEVATLAQNATGSADHPAWSQWMLESTYRAELPLAGGEETRPLGMALDLSSQAQIHWADNQLLPPAPILFLLSTDGLLCPFQIINLVKPPAPNINQAPQALSVAGERPALKISIPPLAASTPVGKSASVARTNLDFSAIGKASVPLPPYNQSASLPPPAQQVPPPQNSGQQLPPRQNFPPNSQPAAVPPQAKPNPLPPISQSSKNVLDDQGGMGPAAQILQEEVAKFVQDLEAFKARSRNVKVQVATQEQKEKLIQMTAELSDFGTELVATTKTQDEEVRALYTELTEVAALLEDARIRHARRRNPRYGHLLKLRPLDPANRRKMDSIERLHVHIEQQLLEASRIMDSIGRPGPSNKGAPGSRKIEIPITQVIYEALKNNARVIMQLTNRLEKIKAQSDEQQLKLAGAAFEALRIKDGEPKSQNWDSELAVLADSLLSSRMDSSRREEIAAAFSPTPSSVLPQVSPEKQALLRNVLSTRPVTRIRAIRPETASESRLLSNLNSIMSCSSSNNNSQPEESPVSAAKPSPKPAQSMPTPLGKTSSILLPQIEDISPPSTPINTIQMDLAAKALTGQKLVSGFSLVPRTSASVAPKPAVAVAVPASSAPPPAYSSSAAGSLSTTPKPAISGAAPAGLIGTPSGKASAFSTTATPTSSSTGFGTPMGSLSSAFGSLPASSAFSSAFSATPTTSIGSFFGAKAATPSSQAPAFSITPVVSKTAAVATPTAPAVTSAPAPAFSAAPVATTPTSTQATIIPKMSSLFGTPATTAPSTPVVTTSAAVSTALPAKPATGSSSFGSSTAAPTAPSSSFSFALPQAAVPAPTSTPSSAVLTTGLSSTPAPPAAATTAGFSSTPAPIAAATTAGLDSTPAPPPAATTVGLSSTPAPSPASSAFSFSLAGNKTAPPASTAPLFSLNASSKPPTAFGVVPTSGGLFGQSPAVGASSVFGQPAAPTVTSTTTSSVFGQAPAVTSSSVFGQPPAVTSSSVFGQPPAVTTSSVFGQPVAATTSSTSLFGQPAVTNAGLTSLFGQASTANPISSAPTTAFASAPLFGRQASSTGAAPAFGAASPGGASTPASPFGASSAFGGSAGGGALFVQPATSSVFGQPAAFGSAAGSSSTSVFGQPTGGSGNVLGSSSSSSSSTGFGVSAPIGQSVFGGTSFGQPASSGSTSAFGGSSMFGGMGLGGTPNAANANRNVFGGGSAFGSSGSSAFGAASPGPSPAPSAFASPAFGQQTSSGFGQPAAFGSSPAFGGAPAFGAASPAFGGPATFGGSPNPMFGGKPTFGSPAAAAPLSPPKVETGGFGAFAAASGPSFGALAASNPQQPAFGGAAYQSPPPAFGGAPSFSNWRS